MKGAPIASHVGWRLYSIHSSTEWTNYLLVAPDHVRGIRRLYVPLKAEEHRLGWSRDVRRLERHCPEVFYWLQNTLAEMPTG